MTAHTIGTTSRPATDTAGSTATDVAHDPTVVEISDLTISFDGRPAVREVSLSVGRGEVVALVGESGSGKTLTARAVLGLLPDTAAASGSIVLNGTETIGAAEKDLRRLRGTAASMIFQEPQTALNPVRTIGWQLAQALRAHRPVGRAAARARAIELLEAVDIPHPSRRIDWYPHQLSGGQKQRVVIALALAGEPDLLIADEPTTALDVTVQAEILALLRDLRDRTGASILLITHNLGVVADLADRVVVMRRGRVVEHQDVAGLFAAPTDPYTRVLLDAIPSIEDIPTRDEVAAADPAGTPIVEVRAVAVDYPARLGAPAHRALEDITLHLDAGEVLGVVGESGSGKSTLGRAILGLLPAAAGDIDVFGIDPARSKRTARRDFHRRVGLIHQDPAASLDPRRTIGQSIAEPLIVHRLAAKAALDRRVTDLLEAVELPRSWVHRRPHELSGGQRQRVAFARALAAQPDLIVADEPTSALDVSVQEAILDLFTRLRSERGFSAVFISHDLAVVGRVSDRVAVLRAGRIVEIGTPEEVFAHPRQEYTRRLVAAVPVPDPARQRERREAQLPLVTTG